MQENDTIFKQLYEKCELATIIYNDHDHILDINPAALALFNIASVTKSTEQFISGLLNIPDDIVNRVKSGETITYSKKIVLDESDSHAFSQNITNPVLFVDISCIPFIQTGGQISAYYVQVTDHTARHLAQEELRKTHEQFILAIDSSRIGIWEWDIQTGATIFNDRWAEIVGYTLEELTPTTIHTWEMLTHPDDLTVAQEAIQKHFSGKTDYYETIFRMKHKDGSIVHVHDRGKVTEWDANGNPIKMAGTHSDITYQKNLLYELKEKTEELEQFFHVTVEMLCIANTDGYFLRLNPAWEHVLGWSKDELLAKKFLDYVHPEDLESTYQAISQLAQQNTVINFVNRYQCRDGTYRWIEWRSAPVGNLIYGAAQDITDRKITETRLVRKKNILDAISYAAMNLMSSLRDDTIENVLSKIGQAVEVSRSYIFTHSYGPDGASLIHYQYEWTDEGITTQKNNSALQNLDWRNQGYERWALALMNGETISGTVMDFPPEEQQLLVEQEIKSLAVVPIFSHDDFHGFIGFDDCVHDHEWSQVELETLEAAAGLLGASFGRKKADEEVEIRDNNLQTFFNTIDDFLFVLTPEGLIAQVNDTVIRRLKYTQEELIGQPILMVHPSSRHHDARHLIEEMLAGTCDFCPIPLITKDGMLIPVETRVVSGIWNGHPALFGVSKDISELTLSEEKFSKAFEASGSLMAMSTVEGRYIDVNKTFLDTLGYTREETIGKLSSDLDIFVRSDERSNIWDEIREMGSIRNKHVMIKTKTNMLLTGILAADIIYIQETEALLTVVNDVTEIIRLSDALLQANKKLNLLSSVTRHDLLNQVQALFFVEEFLDKEMVQDSPARERLELLRKVVDTIHRQILFTKDYQDLGIAAPTWSHVESVIKKEKENKIFSNVLIEVSTGTLEIFTDPMFSKVCYNLLENALRHGGTVTKITISFTETEYGGCLVFEDDGCGVPAADKKKIFNRGFGKNTGLGLFLTAEILSITGMTIQETGEEGKGARFEISVPQNGYRMDS